MKRAGAILGGMALLALSILAAIGVRSLVKSPDIRIVETTATRTEYVRDMPLDYAGMVEAWRSQIAIDGTTSGDWLTVTATDGYKRAERGFRLSGAAEYRNMVLGGVYVRADRSGVRPGAWCMYYRFIIPRVGLGGGCAVDLTGAAVMAGAAWMW